VSRLGALFAGWGFRTATPSFDPGAEVTLFVTGADADGPVARVGDTLLRVTGVPADETVVDRKVRLRVESFDDAGHEGRATYLETVGESAF
jgi:hypothetical protein